ncbi:hypothetical protein J437_LFUL010807 [Ladona fulva]|uniref:Ion transport domain-containing protein n=1 Tax=Ladona fulva TaxID=123851 RepID=A0A8K0KBD1_LADFU|nr:hypothetical protein J437_LFUL010807 [Ladona fulva]
MFQAVAAEPRTIAATAQQRDVQRRGAPPRRRRSEARFVGRRESDFRRSEERVLEREDDADGRRQRVGRRRRRDDPPRAAPERSKFVPTTDTSPASRPTSMTCQELLALSGALSAALPTQMALDTASVHTFFSSLSKGERRHVSAPALAIALRGAAGGGAAGSDACAEDSYDSEEFTEDSEYSDEGDTSDWTSDSEFDDDDYSEDDDDDDEWEEVHRSRRHHRYYEHHHRKKRRNCVSRCLKRIQMAVRSLVEHKYFQQGILMAILVNTLSMGIEYHNQPAELTAIVEMSNIVFSAIFAVEMLLKITAEGPFGYISNGFNVFDGVIVILSVVELCQTFLGERGGGSSGLSVLRTFRLLRILKLVRFMPNLRRQLFVMLRTMDNVAVFFALLILFIFIFSILGMNLFGCKFCTKTDDGSVACDRKNFDSLLWAIVTVFQVQLFPSFIAIGFD